MICELCIEILRVQTSF